MSLLHRSSLRTAVRSSRRAVFSVAPLLLWASMAGAATLSWDPGTTPGTPSGGSGTWDLTTANWSNGSADQAWPNTTGDTAIFGGAAGGTVTLGTTITLGAISFQTDGYTLTGGTLNFGGAATITLAAGLNETIASSVTNGAGNPIPTINAGAGSTMTLSGLVGGSNGATVTAGSGTTVLSGTADNGFLQAVVNSGATLVLAKTSSSGTHALGSNVTVNSGGTLQLGGTGGDQIFYQATVSLAANSTFDLNGRSEGFNVLTGTVASAVVTNTASGTTGTLQLGDNNGNSTFAGTVQDGAGVTAFAKTGSGTVTLTNAANTYSGATTINAGTVSVGTLANGGTASSIGASSNAAANLVFNGGGTLSYTGASVSTDRSFTVNSGGGTLNVATAGTTLTLTGSSALGGTLTVSGPGAVALNGAITNNVVNVATGATANLGGTADNSYLSVTVNGGMLTLTKASSGAVHATGGNIAVSNGGRLQIAGTGGDQIFSNGTTSAGNITLTAATLGISTGVSESVNTLTLGAGASTLTLGTTTSVLRFADSSTQTWTGTLSITNYNGSSTGNGSDQVFFGTSMTGLTAAQLADISFVNPTVNGVTQTGTFGAQLLSTGELVVGAVPEPGTWVGVFGGLGMLCLWQMRRRAC